MDWIGLSAKGAAYPSLGQRPRNGATHDNT
jgi:hypothetical protein